MRRKLAILAIGVATLVVACGPSTPATPADLTDADLAAIKQGEDEWVRLTNAKDWTAAVQAYWSSDAAVLPPNGPAAVGHEAITTWIESFPPFTGFTLEQVSVEGRGDLAYVRGKYKLNVTLPGSTVAIPDEGKHVTIWKKQADGSWKASVGIFNSDLAPPPTTPAKS
jgi:ketosteroid isomerase-like protein